ncbi:ferritin-like domain-containing protein [Pedobacter yulinensis]|nr:ferritin-like domain-containing protein [Pedobacter yulinensis]
MMKTTDNQESQLISGKSGLISSRRTFLQFAGAGMAGMALVAAGCKKNRYPNFETADGVDLGKDDIGILNYAYALEQLEAAFYTQVVAGSGFAAFSDIEKAYLTDIRDHEVAHREFFKNALQGNAIPALEVNFSAINFGDRTSILSTAKAFEDLGCAAYNGAGRLIKDKNYLLLAGKIVSVEARHAALIRDLIANGSFANSEVVDANGLEKSKAPKDVLAIAGAYIKTKINASNLPS